MTHRRWIRCSGDRGEGKKDRPSRSPGLTPLWYRVPKISQIEMKVHLYRLTPPSSPISLPPNPSPLSTGGPKGPVVTGGRMIVTWTDLGLRHEEPPDRKPRGKKGDLPVDTPCPPLDVGVRGKESVDRGPTVRNTPLSDRWSPEVPSSLHRGGGSPDKDSVSDQSVLPFPLEIIIKTDITGKDGSSRVCRSRGCVRV